MIVPPGLQLARALGVLDHRERDAVLDRGAGIGPLRLIQTSASPNRRLMRMCGVLPIVSRMLAAFMGCSFLGLGLRPAAMAGSSMSGLILAAARRRGARRRAATKRSALRSDGKAQAQKPVTSDRERAAADHRGDRPEGGAGEAGAELAELVGGGDERGRRRRRPGRASRRACGAGSATGADIDADHVGRAEHEQAGERQPHPAALAEHHRRDAEHGDAAEHLHADMALERPAGEDRARSAPRRPPARRAARRALPSRHGGCRGHRPAASRSRRRAARRTDRG